MGQSYSCCLFFVKPDSPLRNDGQRAKKRYIHRKTDVRIGYIVAMRKRWIDVKGMKNVTNGIPKSCLEDIYTMEKEKREGNGQGLSVQITPPFPPASQSKNRGGGKKAMMQSVRKCIGVCGMRRKDGWVFEGCS